MGTRFLAIRTPVRRLRGASMVAIGVPLVTLELGFPWAGILLRGSKRIDRQTLTLVAARPVVQENSSRFVAIFRNLPPKSF